MTEEEKRKENETEQTEEKSTFSSPWEQIGRELYEEWESRPAFSYDAASDPLYAQYRDRYVNEGKRAMQDTLGRASAQTGGYASSFATTAAAEAYDSSLEKLTDVIPSLYALARDRYESEGDALLDRISVANTMYERDYDRYRDELADTRYEEERKAEEEREREEEEQKEADAAAKRNRECLAHEKWPAELKPETIHVPREGGWIGLAAPEGIATMIKAGVPDAIIDALIGYADWHNTKHHGTDSQKQSPEYASFKTYGEYLSDYVTRALEQYAIYFG